MMSAEASQEERMLFYQLSREIINLPNLTHAFNESGKLAKEEEEEGPRRRIYLYFSC